MAATRKQDLNSKRTSCGLALAARLGAVRRQSGCEYLLVADLDDVLAAQVPDARLGLVLTLVRAPRCRVGGLRLKPA